MASHLSIAVNQRHLAELEIAVGAAQQLEHLRGRVTEPQETQSQRLQRRVYERLRRDAPTLLAMAGHLLPTARE
jgi:hypothetical protein